MSEVRVPAPLAFYMFFIFKKIQVRRRNLLAEMSEVDQSNSLAMWQA